MHVITAMKFILIQLEWSELNVHSGCTQHDEPPLLSELTVVCLPAVKLPTVYAREQQPRQLRRSHNPQVNSWHLFNAVRERCSQSLQNCSVKVINPLVVTCHIVFASAQTNNFIG